MKKMVKRLAKSTGLQRQHVAYTRMWMERNALALAKRPHQRSGGRILCYHSVGEPEWGVNDVTPDQFTAQIECALAAGYRFVPASHIAKTGGAPKDLAITFDDGLDCLRTTAAPILARYNVPWTFFAVSQWCEKPPHWTGVKVLSWAGVGDLVNAGVDMGSHSATHPDFGKISLAQMHDELAGSRDLIMQRIGMAPTSFAIPFGQSANWTDDAGKAAREAGYDIVYAQAEETRPSGTIPRTFVTSFDHHRIFEALLGGAYDNWEEWI